jgi:RNA polymerase sigma factor (sigma-70 family)
MSDERGSTEDGESSRWIRSARQGDQQAWDHLHRRYRSLLAFCAEAGLPEHLRARFDVEDVLQSAFLAAFRGLSTYEYRGEPAFRAWLKEIVRNELADRIRNHEAHKRSARLEEAVEDPNLLPGAGDGETPSQIVSLSQRRHMVLEAMRQLSDAHQELLWMRDFENLTWDEIGKRAGCTESGARRRYRTALVALVALLRRRRSGLE